ncbi:MAG TPA: hypothetical protein VLQ45_25360 [Thermoanaerobaculia bacterium]|nr:hypothetical protein [Thermoanaerobaculia bacterium]
MQTHPSEEVLEDFILSQDRGRLAVLWHLIGCASCRSKLLFLPRPERPPLEGEVRFGAPDYDRVLAEVGPVVRSFERALKETALSFLQQALAREAVATEVVARVADYLKRAEHGPELRFQGAET